MSVSPVALKKKWSFEAIAWKRKGVTWFRWLGAIADARALVLAIVRHENGEQRPKFDIYFTAWHVLLAQAFSQESL